MSQCILSSHLANNSVLLEGLGVLAVLKYVDSLASMATCMVALDSLAHASVLLPSNVFHLLRQPSTNNCIVSMPACVHAMGALLKDSVCSPATQVAYTSCWHHLLWCLSPAAHGRFAIANLASSSPVMQVGTPCLESRQLTARGLRRQVLWKTSRWRHVGNAL